jgi:hypothetical protein
MSLKVRMLKLFSILQYAGIVPYMRTRTFPSISILIYDIYLLSSNHSELYTLS